MTERPILTEHEKASAVCGKFRDFLAYRLELLRTENDADCTEQETAKRRGSIAEIKAMQGLCKERLDM